jgi:hypothetical protein
MAKHAKHMPTSNRVTHWQGDAELRMSKPKDGEKRKMEGHAAVFDSISLPIWGQREIVRPGAFKKTLADGTDVRALFNHDPNWILGRRSAGTLDLEEIDVGLAVVIDQPDTQAVREQVVAPIDRGDLREMSFQFRTVKEGIAWIDGEPVREILEAHLLDVSPVTFPAYEATDVEVRRMLQSAQGLQAGMLIDVLKADGLSPTEVRAWFHAAADAVKSEEVPPAVHAMAHRARQLQLAELE